MDQPEKFEFEDVRLLVAIPSHTEWDAEFGLSLALLVHHLTMNLVRFHIQNERGSILPQLRQNLLDMALEQECTHMLFLDSDQKFPSELGVAWLRAQRPVIACNIATKGMPSYPTAKKLSGGVPVPHYSDLAGERFTQVGRVGTGIMMLRRDAMQALPRPAFLPGWHEEQQRYIGEDWTMAAHLEAAGIPVVVDNYASRATYHVGRLAFGEEHLVATRKATANDQGSDHRPRVVTLGQA